MVIARQSFCWKWISLTEVSKYGKSEYSRALNACYTFQPLMSFWCYSPNLHYNGMEISSQVASSSAWNHWQSGEEKKMSGTWSHLRLKLLFIRGCKTKSSISSPLPQGSHDIASHALSSVPLASVIMLKGESNVECTPGNSWWGCAAWFSKSWPYFRPKNVIFHTRFQTRPLKSVSVSRPVL